MRAVDIYRRDGDRLAENWVFIDMLHFLNMQGLDVLMQMGFDILKRNPKLETATWNVLGYCNNGVRGHGIKIQIC